LRTMTGPVNDDDGVKDKENESWEQVHEEIRRERDRGDTDD
jgi:hypothetical protein